MKILKYRCRLNTSPICCVKWFLLGYRYESHFLYPKSNSEYVVEKVIIEKFLRNQAEST